MTKQINVEIPEVLSKRVKKDAIEINVTLNEYAKQAFERFLSLTIAQRRVCLGDNKQKKTIGRKIKQGV